jgi:hypothetical protein
MLLLSSRNILSGNSLDIYKRLNPRRIIEIAAIFLSYQRRFTGFSTYLMVSWKNRVTSCQDWRIMPLLSVGTKFVLWPWMQVECVREQGVRWIFGPRREEVIGVCIKLHKKSSVFCTPKYCYGSKCRGLNWENIYIVMEICARYQWGNLDIDVEGMLFMCSLRKPEGVQWINLARGMNHWRALVNMIMNLRVP